MRPFEPLFIWTVLPELLPYMGVTLAVVTAVVLLGTLAGFLLAAAKLSRYRALRLLGDGYTGIVRCTPAVILLFIIFYGLPKFVLEVFAYDINELHKMVFVIITFTLLFAAAMSEVIRSAYLAIERGQYEAAVSVGLTPWQAMYRIILPQGAIIALPNFGNSLINLLKDGALAYTIGLVDLLGAGNLIIARNYGSYALEIYIALAGVYWSMAVIAEHLFAVLERRLSRFKQPRTV